MSTATETNKEKYFVIVETFLGSETDIIKIKASVIALARAGDRLERLLIGEDLK